LFLKRNLTTEVLKQLEFAAFKELEKEVTAAFDIMTRCSAKQRPSRTLVTPPTCSQFTDEHAQRQVSCCAET